MTLSLNNIAQVGTNMAEVFHFSFDIIIVSVIKDLTKSPFNILQALSFLSSKGF